MTDSSSPSRLMLVIAAGPTAAERLAAALAGAPASSVVIVSDGREPLSVANTRGLVSVIQAAGAAALIENDAELARTIRADGVHLRGGVALDPEAAVAAYQEARSIVGGRFIVGAEAGPSRHSAMVLGEAGVDYVAFPDIAYDLHPGADDDEPQPDQLDRLSWWSEIFEVACVATDVTDPAGAGACADAGADFVALTVPNAMSPADVADLVTRASAAVADVEEEDA